jgi:nitrite reductase/ring-hydroxylating ferredoxin subunit
METIRHESVRYWHSTNFELKDLLDSSNDKNKDKQLGNQIKIMNKAIALFRYKKKLIAVDDACPHQKAELHLGDIEDIGGTLHVKCPRHKWKFSTFDGGCRNMESCPSMKQYETRTMKNPNGKAIIEIAIEDGDAEFILDEDF